MDGQNFRLPLGRSFWPLLVEERREIERFFGNEEIRWLVTEEEGRDDDADVRMIDAAYWKKGCSSLGHLRYALLLQIGYKSDRRRHCPLDFKEAVKPQAPHTKGGIPRDYARRVMTGASHLSPYLGSRMQAVEITGKPVFVRNYCHRTLRSK
jgi:uncharacterized protein (DUF2252 family)